MTARKDHQKDRQNRPSEGPPEQTIRRTARRDHQNDRQKRPSEGPPEPTIRRTARTDHQKDRQNRPSEGPPEQTIRRTARTDHQKNRQKTLFLWSTRHWLLLCCYVKHMLRVLCTRCCSNCQTNKGVVLSSMSVLKKSRRKHRV